MPTKLNCLQFSIIALAVSCLAADNQESLKIGRQSDGSVLVPTNQLLTPAGLQVEFPGRPVDLLLVDSGKAVIVKNMRDLTVIDIHSGQIRQVLPLGGMGKRPGGLSAVGMASIGDKVFVSDTASGIRVAKWTIDGKLAWNEEVLELKAPETGASRRSAGAAYPTGLAATSEGKLWVS
jgi:hypothetical protein